MEGKLGPRSRKLICFLRPLPSLRGRPHTAHTRGALMWLRVHSMGLSSSATVSCITQEAKICALLFIVVNIRKANLVFMQKESSGRFKAA